MNMIWVTYFFSNWKNRWLVSWDISMDVAYSFFWWSCFIIIKTLNTYLFSIYICESNNIWFIVLDKKLQVCQDILREHTNADNCLIVFIEGVFSTVCILVYNSIYFAFSYQIFDTSRLAYVYTFFWYKLYNLLSYNKAVVTDCRCFFVESAKDWHHQYKFFWYEECMYVWII
jgi:hypothetical protein